MKVTVEKRLFWFLKEGTELDLSSKPDMDMYVQQTIMRGKESDIKILLTTVKHSDFVDSLGRIRKFLPKEVRRFWEEWLGDINRSAKKDT